MRNKFLEKLHNKLINIQNKSKNKEVEKIDYFQILKKVEFDYLDEEKRIRQLYKETKKLLNNN